MALEIHGNEKTMNLENILLVNIQSSLYFKDLYRLKTYHEVIDEIYNHVEYLSPYIPNTKNPSTAYCLLYKLFLMRMTEKQMIGLIEHQDSPYIRAIGFLYLRYCHPPAQLWSWFGPYLDDEEAIKITPRGQDITMQSFLLDLLREPKFADSLLPRLPTKAQKEIEQNIKEYEKTNNLNLKQPPQKQSSSSSSRDEKKEYGGKYGDTSKNRYNDFDNRDRDRDRGDRDRDRDRYYNDRDRNRDRYYNDRDRERYNDMDYRERDRDRYVGSRDRYNDSRDSRDRNRGYNNDRDWDNNYRSSKKRSRSRSRSRDRNKSRSRSRSRDRNSSTTTTTTTSSDQTTTTKKEESDYVKKLRAHYGADSNQTSLDSKGNNNTDDDKLVLGGTKN
eukprot:gene1512-1904_t